MFDPLGDNIRVSSYKVDFDLVNGTDMSKVPDSSTEYTEMQGGLLPIETKYVDKNR